MDILQNLLRWLEKKPLILLRFPDGFEEAIRGSKNGFERFTFAKPHWVFDDLKLPTLGLVEMQDGNIRKCFVAVVKTKAAITTVDSRLTLTSMHALDLPTLESLVPKLKEEQFKSKLKERLLSPYLAFGLSPKLSVAIIELLAAEGGNGTAIENAARHIPKLRDVSVSEWEQFDAIKTALAAFGLSPSDIPEKVEIPTGSDSTLSQLARPRPQIANLDTQHPLEDDETAYARVLEDRVIERDASVIPGFALQDKHVTGRAEFDHRGERLVVYTANKGPLEKMLGVDLIYFNETLGNMVMVQYKMLEQHTDPGTAKSEWMFRPDDQLSKELNRMILPPFKGDVADYRLHRDPFFFKFVRRKGDGISHRSFVVSLQHFTRLLASPLCKGPKGGLRISFEALEGLYLREADLVGLIRSGYLGTHKTESQALHLLIQKVAEGDRALVVAWQRQVHRNDLEDELEEPPI